MKFKILPKIETKRGRGREREGEIEIERGGKEIKRGRKKERVHLF